MSIELLLVVYDTHELRDVLWTSNDDNVLSPTTCFFDGKVDADIEPEGEYSIDHGHQTVNNFITVLEVTNKDELGYDTDIRLLKEHDSGFGFIVSKEDLENVIMFTREALSSIEDEDDLANEKAALVTLEQILNDTDWENQTLYVSN